MKTNSLSNCQTASDNRFHCFFCLMCLLVLSACGGGNSANVPGDNNEAYLQNNYDLVYEEQFCGNQLPSNWASRDKGVRKLGYVNPNNIELDNCKLKLKVSKESDGRFHTGMVRSKQGHLYGYFEARMKFPLASGIQSAFWMTSPTYHDGDDDPSIYGAEIDVVEQLSRDPGSLYHTIHYDGYGANHKKQVQESIAVNAGGWHLYGVEWTPNGYKFYVDGGEVAHITVGISHVPQVLDLSTEVTTWSHLPPAGAVLPDYLEIDYVKVYEAK